MTNFLQFDKDYRSPTPGTWTLDHRLGGNGQAIAMYKAHAMGKRAAACCVTIVQAEKLASDFNKAGITAEVISGQHSPRERGEIVHRWVSGETRVLCGSAMLHNLPCRAEAVLMMRPTTSRMLYNREVAIGAKRGGYGVLIDLVGNVARHGFPREHYDTFFTPPLPPELNPTGPSIAQLIEDKYLVRVDPFTCPQVYGRVVRSRDGKAPPPESWEPFTHIDDDMLTRLDINRIGSVLRLQDDGMGEMVRPGWRATEAAIYAATCDDVH
ncbi:hypothetical protein [Tardiphaga sp. 862_B3_N1_1]|uniref:hypothetical protein n=1 Tax=Tardiphaga sp. 862_B3_N1_1 TaxID=3240763 RepID=UPI003F89E102